MINLFDFIPNIINPYMIKKLASNVEAAILLECIKSISSDSSDENGKTFIQLNQLQKMTGLSENKIKNSERFLKKKNLIITKIENRIKYYKLNYSEYLTVKGIAIKPTLVGKLNHNAKAALLLTFYVDYNNSQGISLISAIPSREIEYLTGLDRKSQIYARDSLLSYQLIKTLQCEKESQYVLNVDEYNRFVTNHRVIAEAEGHLR